MADIVNGRGQNGAENASLASNKTVKPSPDTLTKLIKRLRALTLELLPVEVDAASINEPTSRIITPRVIQAFTKAAGDFNDALPYCLLRARAEFMWDANHNPADYGENYGRAIACEVLARRIIHNAPPEQWGRYMSMRFRHRQVDGDESDMSSALELAIDSNSTIFLSSSEAQEVVNQLWNGRLVQKNNPHQEIEYVPYAEYRQESAWGPFDISRLSVPRYQNFFRIIIWFFFLVVYSQAVQQPLDKVGNANNEFDVWEIILYFMGLSFAVEDTYKIYSLLMISTWRALTFWNIVAWITDSLLTAAFILRMIGLTSTGSDVANYRLISFQVLSFVSPFIWMKLIPIFDGYKYIGTLQICVSRMLKESGIFFALLSVLAIGFAQGLYALDAADGTTDHPSVVTNQLIQALFGSPDFERYSQSSPGLILYYLWNAVTAIILLNVLISLFSSAYSDVVDDAEAQYLAYFAGKTIGMIRAPDSFVYPAPFNMIEVLFIAPFELFPKFRLSNETYTKLNRIVMSFIFCIPLTLIALFEATFGREERAWMHNWLRGDDEGGADYPEVRDPEVHDDEAGRKISRVSYEELVKMFPDTTQSSEACIMKELTELRKQMDAIMRKLENQA